MNAKDLMLNDWVQDETGTIIGQVIKLDIFSARIEFAYHMIDANYVYPIQLTPEILEKNGFVYNENREAWEQIPNDGYGICYEDNTYLFSLGIFDPFNRNSDITYHTIAEIKYVHELQHALKLCGIDKEIVL